MFEEKILKQKLITEDAKPQLVCVLSAHLQVPQRHFSTGRCCKWDVATNGPLVSAITVVAFISWGFFPRDTISVQSSTERISEISE